MVRTREERLDLLVGDDDELEEKIRVLRAAIAAREKVVASTPQCERFLPKRKDIFEVVPKVEGVQYIAQDKANNCGQTALRMVGIDEEILMEIGEANDRQLSTLDMHNLCDRGMFLSGDVNRDLDAAFVGVILNTYPGGQNHWVVVAGEYIFDPAIGVMVKDAYQEALKPAALAVFERN